MSCFSFRVYKFRESLAGNIPKIFEHDIIFQFLSNLSNLSVVKNNPKLWKLPYVINLMVVNS